MQDIVKMEKDIETLNSEIDMSDGPKDDKIYFHKENLTRSCEGFDCPLLTISSKDYELDINEVYNTYDKEKNKFMPSKCKRFDVKKPVILLTSRVHPGETPCSHALNGIFLCNNY